MSAPASLVTDNGYNFSFLSAKTPNGYIPVDPIVKLKDIRVPGVDYNRQRQENLEFPEFLWNTLAESSTYETAVVLAGQYDKSIGHLARLTTTIRSGLYVIKNVMILEHNNRAVLGPGRCIGPDANTSFTGCVVHQWKLQCTEIYIP